MSIEKKTKITVDTNVLISAYVFPGMTVINLIEKAIDGDVLLGISEEILREFIDVCIFKLHYDPQKTIKISEEIRLFSVIVEPKVRLKVIADEPDNRILECAAEFKADFLVSGDRHLLDLKKYKGIDIVTPADFLKKSFR